MKTPDVFLLAQTIERAALAVPGITAVYQAEPILPLVLETHTEAFHEQGKSSCKVSIAQDNRGLSVAIAVGVQLGYKTPETARIAHNTIRTLLDHRGLTSAKLRLTVVHIDGDSH